MVPFRFNRNNFYDCMSNDFFSEYDDDCKYLCFIINTIMRLWKYWKFLFKMLPYWKSKKQHIIIWQQIDHDNNWKVIQNDKL